MAKSKFEFSIGIEEEYMIVDPTTGQLYSAIENVLTEATNLPGPKITAEIMQCQVEVGTEICSTISQARSQLLQARRTVYEILKKQGLAFIAVGTHPFSKWSDQSMTVRDRYLGLELENQILARQLLISGMHMHIGIEDKDLRIDLMNQLSYFCPHLLCLSTSSPFWGGIDTGLMSYRSVIFEAMPRTGIPPQFRSWNEYMEYIDVAIQTNCIDEPTKIRWDLRPSPKYPTLEYRVCDVVTRIDDALAISALKVALVAKLLKLRRNNMQWRLYRREHIQENKWRAVRYGLNGKLLDLGRVREVDARKLVVELLAFVDDVVDDLDLRDEISHIPTILARGTSADLQLKVYKETGGNFKAVVDRLIQESVAGIV